MGVSLDKGLLVFKETTLQADGGLALSLKGSLPIVSDARSDDPFRLTLPWTDAAVLLSPWVASTSGQPVDTRVTGQIQGDLKISRQQVHGALVLQNVSIVSDFLHLDGVSGTIPWPDGSVSCRVRIGHRRLKRLAGRMSLRTPTRRHWRNCERARDPTSPATPLTIALLRYGAIELRNFEAALAPEGDHIAIPRLGFEAWGGRVSGSGALQPLGGKAAVALLAEGISLRAICDAFPAIKGYISGRLNGLADLSISQFRWTRLKERQGFGP